LNPDLHGKGYVYASPIVRLRQLFDLHVNLRPCRAYPGNPLNFRDDIDLVIFRQNTEGSYAGVEFYPIPEPVNRVLAENHPKMAPFAALDPDQVAVSLRIVTRRASRKILKAAFDYAVSHGCLKVTLAEKPNVLRETGGLILREARELAAAYPNIDLEETNIDALCMWLVRKPQEFGVIAAENLFGDIISDLAGGLVGGLGFASSANIGDNFAVFEPTHGSAPKYAGLYKVNPMAMILSLKLMLDYLGETDRAARLDRAVSGVVAEGKVCTYDMGGAATTMEMAAAVAERME
jgi:3-isopropylmalate dehydrogenase